MEQLARPGCQRKIWNGTFGFPSIVLCTLGEWFYSGYQHPESQDHLHGKQSQKQQIYVLFFRSIYHGHQTGQQKHRPEKQPCIWWVSHDLFNGIDTLWQQPGQQSSNYAGCTGLQSVKKDYGRDQAEVIMNIVETWSAGRWSAKRPSSVRAFGKIVQERESVSVNASDTSGAVYPIGFRDTTFKIASLSSGEFVEPFQTTLTKDRLKVFHAEIINVTKPSWQRRIAITDPIIRTIKNMKSSRLLQDQKWHPRNIKRKLKWYSYEYDRHKIHIRRSFKISWIQWLKWLPEKMRNLSAIKQVPRRYSGGAFGYEAICL